MLRRSLVHVTTAVVAFSLGIAATAGAAALLTGKDIKNGTLQVKDLSRKAQKALRGKRGPQGLQGLQGSPGGAGAPGTNGTPGSSGVAGPTLFIASMGTTSWSTPGAGNNAGSEDTVQAPIPPGGAFTAKTFSARTNNPPGGGNTVTIAFRINSADTALACSITGAAQACQPPGNPTVVVPEGSLISMHATSTGGAATTVGYSFRGEF